MEKYRRLKTAAIAAIVVGVGLAGLSEYCYVPFDLWFVPVVIMVGVVFVVTLIQSYFV